MTRDSDNVASSQQLVNRRILFRAAGSLGVSHHLNVRIVRVQLIERQLAALPSSPVRKQANTLEQSSSASDPLDLDTTSHILHDVVLDILLLFQGSIDSENCTGLRTQAIKIAHAGSEKARDVEAESELRNARIHIELVRVRRVA